MIRRLGRKNAEEYFSSENIVMLVLAGDRSVYGNMERRFFAPLVFCANYVTNDLQLSREVARKGIYELYVLIRNGMPITEYEEQLYCLLWQKIMTRLYPEKTRPYILSLKDAFIRAQVLAEFSREKTMRIPGGWFRKWFKMTCVKSTPFKI